jgi:hypothetical protein
MHIYTEDNLVQQITVEYTEQQLGWELVCSSHHDLSFPCLSDGEMTL